MLSVFNKLGCRANILSANKSQQLYRDASRSILVLGMGTEFSTLEIRINKQQSEGRRNYKAESYLD